jgi:hypothetical protein
VSYSLCITLEPNQSDNDFEPFHFDEPVSKLKYSIQECEDDSCVFTIKLPYKTHKEAAKFAQAVMDYSLATGVKLTSVEVYPSRGVNPFLQ